MKKCKTPKMSGNDFIDVHAVRTSQFDGSGWPAAAGIHSKREPDHRARFAMACIERWGMVAAEPDGEDSTGRQKLKLSRPRDIVYRAMECADMVFEEFDRAGWLVNVPSVDELRDAVQETESAND